MTKEIYNNSKLIRERSGFTQTMIITMTTENSGNNKGALFKICPLLLRIKHVSCDNVASGTYLFHVLQQIMQISE